MSIKIGNHPTFNYAINCKQNDIDRPIFQYIINGYNSGLLNLDAEKLKFAAYDIDQLCEQGAAIVEVGNIINQSFNQYLESNGCIPKNINKLYFDGRNKATIISQPRIIFSYGEVPNGQIETSSLTIDFGNNSLEDNFTFFQINANSSRDIIFIYDAIKKEFIKFDSWKDISYNKLFFAVCAYLYPNPSQTKTQIELVYQVFESYTLRGRTYYRQLFNNINNKVSGCNIVSTLTYDKLLNADTKIYSYCDNNIAYY